MFERAHLPTSRPDPVSLESRFEDRSLRRELATAPLRAPQHKVRVPDGPGLDIDPDPADLLQFGMSFGHPVEDSLEAPRP